MGQSAPRKISTKARWPVKPCSARRLPRRSRRDVWSATLPPTAVAAGASPALAGRDDASQPAASRSANPKRPPQGPYRFICRALPIIELVHTAERSVTLRRCESCPALPAILTENDPKGRGTSRRCFLGFPAAGVWKKPSGYRRGRETRGARAVLQLIEKGLSEALIHRRVGAVCPTGHAQPDRVSNVPPFPRSGLSRIPHILYPGGPIHAFLVPGS